MAVEELDDGRHGAACAAFACGPTLAQSGKQISGVAAYYSKDYRGLTASGERYDPNKFTCAHRTLPFGTRVLVTDPRTTAASWSPSTTAGLSAKAASSTCRLAAAKELHMLGRGLIRVTAAVQ